MISVRLLGHIRTSVGREMVEIEEGDIDAAQLVERLRSMSIEREPGFTPFNTLVMVEDGEAYVPAKTGKRIASGQRVVLIPFSHGG